MIMISIKEALTFDDVTLKPKYSNVLPTEVNTRITLSKNLFLKQVFHLMIELNNFLLDSY